MKGGKIVSRFFINLEALHRTRINKNIPMREMAEALGLKTPGGYARIESGEVKLKAEHLPIIAAKFELTVDQLVNLLFRGSNIEETSNKNTA